MKLLITAFEPFGNDNFNNSIKVLEKLDIECIKKIIPVSYPDAEIEVKKLVELYNPDFIIHLGMAKSREKLTIEQIAKNKLEFKIPDNAGNILNQPISLDYKEDFIKNKIDFLPICNQDPFKDKLYLSLDAGTYICNYVYFTSLINYPDKTIIFIHIPSFSDKCDVNLCVNTIKDFIDYMKGI